MGTAPNQRDRFAMGSLSGAGTLGRTSVGAARVPVFLLRPSTVALSTVKRSGSGCFTQGGAERIADAVALHAPPEGHPRDAERGGGSLAVPPVRLEDVQN